MLFQILCMGLVMMWQTTACAGGTEEKDMAALESLLNELKVKIEEADKRMIAHPHFLEELRALVEKYKAKIKKIFFFDDFSDRDYTKDPKWTVKAGYFELTRNNRLWSRIYTDRPSSTSSSSEEEEPLGILLKEIMRASDKREEKKEEKPKQSYALIHTLADFGAAFELDISLVSQSKWGAMEIILLGGKRPAVPRYHLIYYAAPSQDRPVEIIRERGARKYVIESAARYPNLDDGRVHRLQWIRDSEGNMRVLIDGQEILSTIEYYYRDDFSGLALLNRGGTYEWGPITISEAPAGKTNK